MEPHDTMIFMSLLRWASEHLSVKTCRVTDAMWIVIKGVLPSGAFDTSHVGSFIIALLLCSYIAEKSRLKEGGPEIRLALKQDKIRIGVYGDDHELSRPTNLREYLNEKLFAEYVARVHGMTIKPKTIRCTSGITELDVNHNIKKEGTVFLKKRIIRKDNLVDAYDWPLNTVDLLAFRKCEDYYVKVCFGVNRQDVYDTAAAIIGLAFDNCGVCIKTHKYLFYMYTVCRTVTKDAMFPQGVLRAIASTKDTSIQKFLYRKGKTLKDITGEFPSIELLRRRHVKDLTKCKIRYGPHHYGSPAPHLPVF